MKIYQMVGTLSYGDAIGNNIIAIKHVIEEMGIKTFVYALSVSDRVTEHGVYDIGNMPKLNEDDIVIYHMSSGSPMNAFAAELNCRKIMIYHNITPFEFFTIDDPGAANNCRKGLEDMVNVMKGHFNSYLAVSEFNKKNMIEMGYKAEQIDVIPIIVPFDDYRKTPDEKMVKKLSDGVTNIVFVGRIAPNKKHEDIIRAFAYYKNHVNPNSRLTLVGSANPNGCYFRDLQEYIRSIGVQDVVFPGHISFEEILAIYKTADVFLCMSEHEGFCVPLVEAMLFDVPVIAYDSCAVPDTLGGSGVVVDSKDPVFLSKVIDGVVSSRELRENIISGQRERLKDFEYETIKKQLQDYLSDFIRKFPPLSPDDSKKSYRNMYDIVNNNMQKAGKTLDFTSDAVIACADREAELTDVTAILNKNLSPRATIETVFIAFFNQLPTPQELSYWEEQAKQLPKSDFMKAIISFAESSELRLKKGTRVMFNPFQSKVLRADEEGAAIV